MIDLRLGDCAEILPTLEGVDAVITDPPYGIGKVWKGGFSSKHGWGKAGAQAEARNEWDAEPPKKEIFDALLTIAKTVIIWGGNYFPLPTSRGWLVWVKPERNFTLSEAELAWTNLDMPMRVFEHRRSDPGREHPTQKPVGLMAWCIEKYTKPGDTILDLFMGSGTTLRAAKDLGRKAIGIEIEEHYCEMAAKRLAQEVLPLQAPECLSITPVETKCGDGLYD